MFRPTQIYAKRAPKLLRETSDINARAGPGQFKETKVVNRGASDVTQCFLCEKSLMPYISSATREKLSDEEGHTS